MTNPIPSPYNFVPLAKDIFFPDWANQVSHDIPFSNGISGEIKIKVIAKTPVYVRNGYPFTNDAERERARTDTRHPHNDFFHIGPNGYMIPGTSLKGMLRAVMEIASFGKMSMVDNKRYSIRDLYFSAYTSAMTENIRGCYRSRVQAGWLKIDKGEWKLVPCQYARVEQDDLEKYFQSIAGNRISIGKKRENCIAKYNYWTPSLKIQCDIDSCEENYRHSCGNLQYRKASNLGKGSQTGTLVFTGQPMPRMPGKTRRKHMEFIFYNDSKNILDATPLRNDFEFIHSDDRGCPLDEWKYWKEKLERGYRIPVFYLPNTKGEPMSIGLAMMYRLPYELTIHDAIKNTAQRHIESKAPDLAETIFGYVRDKEALRGRVQVGHFRALKAPSPETAITTVLGTPKPTYYPNYIVQNETNGNIRGNYKTLMDRNAQIRGWKRYPVRQDNFRPSCPNPIQDKVASVFKPLPSGTEFQGSIRVHNLRPEELGALVWAITWGGDSLRRHSIGMAKPYGYGSVRLEILEANLHDICDQSIDHKLAMKKFVETMNKWKADWEKTEQFTELMAMASPTTAPTESFDYPKLTTRPNNNEFADYKKDKKALRKYSEILRESGSKNPGKADSQPSSSSKDSGPLSIGQKVKCKVLEKKKKGKEWRFEALDMGKAGRGQLHPRQREKTPEDIAAGEIYTLVVIKAQANNNQFGWPES